MKGIFFPQFFLIETLCGPDGTEIALSYLPLGLKRMGQPQDRDRLDYEVRRDVVRELLANGESLERVRKEIGDEPAPSFHLVAETAAGNPANLDEAVLSKDPELVLGALLVADALRLPVPVGVYQNPSAMRSPLIRLAIRA